MSNMIKVIGGWVIQDQAAAVPGLETGPTHLTGAGRAGPLGSLKHHNLIGKDIVFFAEGKHALFGILQVMQGMSETYVRSGIRPGMPIEKFVASEYGGGDDQVTVEATESDIVRIPYYIYAYKLQPSPYEFRNLLISTMGSMINMIPTTSAAFGAIVTRTAMDAGIATVDGVNRMRSVAPNGLQQAAQSSKAVVVLSSRQRHGVMPVATHSHTHRISTIAGEIRARIH